MNSMNKNGFTLIELLLYSAVSVTIILATSALYATIMQVHLKTQTIATVEEQGAHIALVMTQTIRNARRIATPTPATEDVVLQATMNDPNVDPTIFRLVNGTLIVSQGKHNSEALNNTRVAITDLTFQNASPSAQFDSIKMQFTVMRTSTEARNEFSYSKTFSATASIRTKR